MPNGNQIEIHPSTFLIDPECAAVGGKESHRELIRDERQGPARETEARVEIRVEDMEEREAAEKIARKGFDVIRKHTVKARVGMLCPAERIPVLEAEIALVREEADRFNASARTCSVEIGFSRWELVVSLGSEAAQKLATHIQTQLADLHTALRTGDARAARNLLLPAQIGNLDSLAVGIVAESIRFAIEEGRDRLAELSARSKGKGKAIVETPESIGRSLDLSMIESAIGMVGGQVPTNPSSKAA